MTIYFYLDDDEAREDFDQEDREEWMREREAFQRPADEEDQPPEDSEVPTRFWIDGASGLPIVRDRLFQDQEVARFVTLGGAQNYLDLREVGLSHRAAWWANPEIQGEDVA